MNRPIYIAYVLLLLFCACTDHAKNDICLSDRPSIRVVFPVTGLGDRGYSDNIFEGVCRARERYAPTHYLTVETYSVASTDRIETLIDDWFRNPVSTRQLLIVSDGTLAPMFDRHPNWKTSPSNMVLILDSNRSDQPVYSRFLQLYGISHLAGQVVAGLKLAPAAVVLGNNQDFPLQESAAGFCDGYRIAGGNPDSISILPLSPNSSEGFNMADSLYRLSYRLDGEGYRFVLPVCGGSSNGLYRYTRQNDDASFYTCGIDVDAQNSSGKVLFSLLKRYDMVVEDFIGAWLDGQEQERHVTYGIGSEYLHLLPSNEYSGIVNDICTDTLTVRSVMAERQFYESLESSRK